MADSRLQIDFKCLFSLDRRPFRAHSTLLLQPTAARSMYGYRVAGRGVPRVAWPGYYHTGMGPSPIPPHDSIRQGPAGAQRH